MFALPLTIGLCLFAECLAAKNTKNVLFLVADDMRPEISCYVEEGETTHLYSKMITPNLDRLASQSLLVKRAFAQHAICTPSRASFLTGRRPETTKVLDLETNFRESGGDFTTIPQYFKKKGYKSIGIGKIFDPRTTGKYDSKSWSEDFIPSEGKGYNDKTNSWKAIPKAHYENNIMPDQSIAKNAIAALQGVAIKALSGEKQFFLAVGFKKPHLPFIFPEEFLEKYPLQDIGLPSNPYAPVDMPRIAWASWPELRKYEDIAALSPTGDVNTTLPDSTTIDLRRAYYSAITYIDSLVGEVLKELENLGLANNTVVSFLSDHGFQLGEHGSWCKGTNFETSTHVPLMVKVPGSTDQGVVTNKLVELVDVFPTLSEAAGLGPVSLCPKKSSRKRLCVEGHSILPLINDPSSASWKKRVFSWYPRRDETIMGYSMRTESYRYTEWVGFSGKPDYKPDWDDVEGVELYDITTDPLENRNIAENEDLKDVVKTLSGELHAGWRDAQPAA